MEEVKVYRRRALTLMLLILFGAITIVMVIGLVQSYFPRYTGFERLKITDTGRMISIIFMLFTAAFAWRYLTAFIRRGRVPVITITPAFVRFNLRRDDTEVLYFHDIDHFSAIEGNFETAMVHYRVKVPEGTARYPAAIEVPLGLTMTRSQVLAILNQRAAQGAALPAPPVDFHTETPTPDELAAQKEECEVRKNLPPLDRTVRVYWERSAPVVALIGILVLIFLVWLVMRDPDMAEDYLLFVRLVTWCRAIEVLLIIGALVVLGYLAVALTSPKLVLMPEALRYRGETVAYADLVDVTVEATRKWAAPHRYVTEHFIRFNYRPDAKAPSLPGLDPDLLEMRPRRIAAIINSRIACLKR